MTVRRRWNLIPIATPSDAGPWTTVDDVEHSGAVHVIPGFGPAHDLGVQCWCHPDVVVTAGYWPMVTHNVAQ